MGNREPWRFVADEEARQGLRRLVRRGLKQPRHRYVEVLTRGNGRGELDSRHSVGRVHRLY